ncbi:hypothetical protein CPB86DRAFT_825352 [Serendipita vermifera]|nr:hypothetical protein CPB86DRAFT_825352 [Serendipita vermifera]
MALKSLKKLTILFAAEALWASGLRPDKAYMRVLSMSSTFAADLHPRTVPILAPRSNPHFIYEFLLRHIPVASLAGQNTLSNNDILSPLCYTFSTTPEFIHPWIIFKFVQEDALKAGAGVTPAHHYSEPYSFPPSPFLADISKTIVEFWKTLEPSDIAEWEELARDIRNIYGRIVTLFGNGSTFDGRSWEEQRSYHARTLYFKWMGYQATYGNTSQ